MQAFHLQLKEKDKPLETIYHFNADSGEANEIFGKVKEKFSDALVAEKQENEPFLYMKVMPIREPGSQTAASIIPTACFNVSVKEDMFEFIRKEE